MIRLLRFNEQNVTKFHLFDPGIVFRLEIMFIYFNN
jgi:hypothetical protein